jgi:hypothetical protein
MKRIGLYICLGIMAFLANSCEIEQPARYFEVNGKKSTLNVAYADPWGTSGDLTSRWYAISFRSQELDPENYITFLLGSFTNETDFIAEGTYDYDYLSGRGLISDLSVGYDIAYDYLGYPTGTRFDEDVAVFSGTITIEYNSGTNYHFYFDLTAVYNNSTYAITGEFDGSIVFNASVVDIDTY